MKFVNKWIADTDLDPSQTFMMKLLAKIVYRLQQFTICNLRTIRDVWQGSKFK